MMWRLLLILGLIVTSGCSASYNLDVWQTKSAIARPQIARGENTDDELQQVDRLRNGLELEASRKLALELAAEHPDDPKVLWRASRAESDDVFLFEESDKDQRALAALSSLDYARRATQDGNASVEARAQLAWALGLSIHLQPMMTRSKTARETKAVIDSVLTDEPNNAVALATDAILNYRLCTLPWIAKVMAVGAPKASLDAAETQARHAYSSVPSIENAEILARILNARQKTAEAHTLLSDALDRPDLYPRDRELRDAARRLMEKYGK